MHLLTMRQLHQWLGRAIALLAIAQIPIGLALYGSPIWLFILYAIFVFALLVLYFILTYERQRRQGIAYWEGTESSYTTATGSGRPQRSGIGGWAAPAAAGAGLASLRNRLSGRRSEDQHDNRPTQQNQSHSQYTDGDGSYWTEKEDHTWRNRFLGAVGGFGAFEGARRLFGRRDDRTELSDQSMSDQSYNQGHDQRHRHRPTESALAMTRVEEGRPLPQQQQQEPPDDWRRVEDMEAAQAAAAQRHDQPQRPAYPPGMASEMSERPNGGSQNSSQSSKDDRPGGFIGKVADAMGIGSVLERRRRRKRQDEAQRERQRKYEANRISGNNEYQPLVQPNGLGPEGRMPNVMESPRRYQPGDGPGQGQGPVPYPPQNGYGYDGRPPGQEQPHATGPPPPPPPMHHEFAYGPSPPPQMRPQTASGSPRIGPHTSQRPSPRVNFAPGTAPGSPTPRPPVSQNVPLPPPPPHVQSMLDSTTSQSTTGPPPVSVHVRDSDGHIHVRRLNPEEAVAERRATRQQAANIAAAQGLHQQSQAQSQIPQQRPQTETGPQVPAHTSPPPPHIMGGNITSSPSAYGGTQASNYEENRQRRRAERARVQQARQAQNVGNDGRIDYT